MQPIFPYSTLTIDDLFRNEARATRRNFNCKNGIICRSISRRDSSAPQSSLLLAFLFILNFKVLLENSKEHSRRRRESETKWIQILSFGQVWDKFNGKLFISNYLKVDRSKKSRHVEERHSNNIRRSNFRSGKRSQFSLEDTPKRTLDFRISPGRFLFCRWFRDRGLIFRRQRGKCDLS